MVKNGGSSTAYFDGTATWWMAQDEVGSKE